MDVVLEAVLVLEVALHLVLDELLGAGDLDALEELVDDLVAGLGDLAEDLGLADLDLEVRAQLVDGVELAGDLREVVVGLGQLTLLDGLDGDGDLGRLALVVAAEQLRLEGGALTGGEGLEGLVDAVDEVAGAELVGDAARGVDGVAADGGGEVDLDEVARLRGAVDRDQRAEAAAQAVELGRDLVVGDLDGVHGELEALVRGQVELGADVDLDLEEEVAGEVLAGPLLDVGLGAAEGTDVRLLDGGLVEAVHAVVDGVLQHGLAADALVDDGRRHLALAEAGDGDLLGDVAVCVVDVRLQVFGGGRDRELDARGAQLFDRGLHVWSSPVIAVRASAETAFRRRGCGRGDRTRTCGLPLPKRTR